MTRSKRLLVREKLKKRRKHVRSAATVQSLMPDWIVDTGASYHIQDGDCVDESAVRVSATPKVVESANGTITLKEETNTEIPSLGPLSSKLTMKVWKGTPNLLSLGRLVHEHKCKFGWVPGRRPTLTLPNGVRIKLAVRRHVPYLPHDIA